MQLANSHPNSVEKAGQMIWHNGKQERLPRYRDLHLFRRFQPVPLTSLLALAVRTDLAVAAPTNPTPGAGVYNDRELGPAFRGRARWRVPVAPHTCPKYHSIAGIPTPRQKSVEGAHAVLRGLRPLQRPHRRRRPYHLPRIRLYQYSAAQGGVAVPSRLLRLRKTATGLERTG